MLKQYFIQLEPVKWVKMMMAVVDDQLKVFTEVKKFKSH